MINRVLFFMVISCPRCPAPSYSLKRGHHTGFGCGCECKKTEVHSTALTPMSMWDLADFRMLRWVGQGGLATGTRSNGLAKGGSRTASENSEVGSHRCFNGQFQCLLLLTVCAKMCTQRSRLWLSVTSRQ